MGFLPVHRWGKGVSRGKKELRETAGVALMLGKARPQGWGAWGTVACVAVRVVGDRPALTPRGIPTNRARTAPTQGSSKCI